MPHVSQVYPYYYRNLNQLNEKRDLKTRQKSTEWEVYSFEIRIWCYKSDCRRYQRSFTDKLLSFQINTRRLWV
jgi:hypothetical protein